MEPNASDDSQPQTTPPQHTAATARKTPYSWITLAIAAVAVALLAWQWYASDQQIKALQLELARRLTAADVENRESRGLAEQVREATREAQAKIGVLEANLKER